MEKETQSLTHESDRLTEVKNQARSYSQLSQYKQCPWQYYLRRVRNVWQRPAAWLPQGTAVHTAAEAWEKSGRAMDLEATLDVYRESFAKQATAMCVDTPNLDWWFSSGPYHGELDLERRFALGEQQVARYLDYYEETAPNEVIWITEDGTPAIELGFNTVLPGGVKVRGYIDQVIQMPAGEIRPRDIKTGNKPGDELQLATYGAVLTVEHGVTVVQGDYWMGRNGKPTVPYSLREWSVDRVGEAYLEMDQAVKAERFDPDPEPSKCRFCPAQLDCSYSDY